MPCFAPGRLATLLLVVSCGCHVGGSLASPPKPTPDVLAWTKREMAAFFSFNMITMASNVSDLCSVNGRFSSWLPPPDIFDPAMLDVDQWVRTAAAMGAKYAILTTKHCSGFNLWPTDIYDETGFEYMYSTRYSSFRGGSYDVVKDFVTSCAEHGIKPGIYYSFNENFYLNVAGGVVLNTPLIAGQAKVTQDQYKSIALADIRSLLTNYGELSEIWLDSGCSIPGLSEVIADLLTATQPTAVYFNGCTPNFINVVRWVGTESGLPSYPIWSTSSDCGGSHGSPSGLYFCPAESDTTLQLNDQWFWRAGHPIRSLSDLQQVYYHTVGQNTNLLLNVPANSSGLIEDTYFQRLVCCKPRKEANSGKEWGRGGIQPDHTVEPLIMDT